MQLFLLKSIGFSFLVLLSKKEIEEYKNTKDLKPITVEELQSLTNPKEVITKDPQDPKTPGGEQ